MPPAARQDRASMLAVVLAAVLAYAATLTYDLVWDDIILIRDRLPLYSLANLRRLLLSDFFSDGTAGGSTFFRPLIAMSFFGDLSVWGLNAAGFHLTNVVGHALTSAAVWSLALRVTGNPAGALIAGLLF